MRSNEDDLVALTERPDSIMSLLGNHQLCMARIYLASTNARLAQAAKEILAREL